MRDDIAALCIRAGDPICVPAVGACASIAGSAGSQSHKQSTSGVFSPEHCT